MASVHTGEVVFPIFVSLERPTMNEDDLGELTDILIRPDFVEDIKWDNATEVELKCRVQDVDDFSHDELEDLCNELEEEIHYWEERVEV